MTDLPDGIYFGLPMEQYVALPRLGAHSLGKLLVSAATYWEASHLNPAPREVSKAVHDTRVIGSAYHCARLEPEHFADRYVRELDKADMPEGSLFTGGDMAAELKRRELKVTGSVGEQAARLEEAGFPASHLWQFVSAAWQAENELAGGRVALSSLVWDQIITDGERLRQSPEVAALLASGFAEVSILWTEASGIKCKCRPDKLGPDYWLDLKTFANVGGKNVEQAITDAIRFNRYHVGAAHYRDGIAAVRAGLPIMGEATAEQGSVIALLQEQPDFPACWYVFQEKGGIPNILAKRMRFHEVPIGTEINHAMTDDAEVKRQVERATETPSLWWERAKREIKKAKRTFRTYSEVYAPGEPWLPFNPLGEISDLSFGSYWLDEEIGE